MAEPELQRKRRVVRRWRESPEETGPELTEDMTGSDLIWTLQRLPFPRRTTTRSRRNSATCLIAIDRHARDYIVGAITKRRGK
jgi:hypothetical protein